MANHDLSDITMKVDNGGSDIREIKISAPSNSNSEKKAAEEKKKRDKVVTGNVIRKKPSAMKKVTDVFFGEDIDNIKDYVIFDVLIPAIKDTLFETFTGGLSMTLFGTGSKKGNKLYRDKGNTYVSYNSMFNNKREPNRAVVDRSRSLYNFDEIILESKAEAEEVLSNLVDLIEDYGLASVGDLYDFLGLPGEFTDQSYGWNNLSSASVRRVREGYILHLPKPQLIK